MIGLSGTSISKRAASRDGFSAAPLTVVGGGVPIAFLLGNGPGVPAMFVVTAVVFERHGSLSHVVFGLPLVRTLPQKFPQLRAYFALDHMPSTDGSDEVAEFPSAAEVLALADHEADHESDHDDDQEHVQP